MTSKVYPIQSSSPIPPPLTISIFPAIKVFIVTSHHARIVCLLYSLLKGVNDGKEIALNNVAVVRVFNDGKGQLHISLLVEGSSVKQKQKYKDITWKVGTTTPSFDVPIDPNLFPGMDVQIPFVIYFIRHGQGVHNTMNTFQKIFHRPYGIFWDPLLINSIGIKDAANAIRQDLATTFQMTNLHNLYSQVTYISSPLRRCIETMLFLISYLFPLTSLNPSNPTVPPLKVNIVPCLHELPAKAKKGKMLTGTCDTSKNKLVSSSYFGAQNASRCLSKLGTTKQTQCTTFSYLFPQSRPTTIPSLSQREANVWKTLQQLKPLNMLNPSVPNSSVSIDWTLMKGKWDCTRETFFSYLSKM
jgi:hypothetical protein